MFLHLNHLGEIYAERRRRDERQATVRRLATQARRRTAGGGATLATLLDEVGSALRDGDRLDDPRRIVLLEALVTELAAAVAAERPAARVLLPREGEPPVVALRTLGAIAVRTAGGDVAVGPRRVAVVRELLRQLDGADGTGDRTVAGSPGARRWGAPGPASPAAAPTRCDDGCDSLSA